MIEGVPVSFEARYDGGPLAVQEDNNFVDKFVFFKLKKHCSRSIVKGKWIFRIRLPIQHDVSRNYINASSVRIWPDQLTNTSWKLLLCSLVTATISYLNLSQFHQQTCFSPFKKKRLGSYSTNFSYDALINKIKYLTETLFNFRQLCFRY